MNGLPTLKVENFFQPFSTNTQFSSPLVYSFDPHARTPYVTEWNLSVQRKLGNNMALDIGYVGSKGTHLEMNIPGNVPAIDPTDTRTFQEQAPVSDIRRQFLSGESEQQHLSLITSQTAKAVFERAVVPGFVYIFEVD